MAKIEYVPKNFNAKTQAIIDKVNLVLDEYEADGIDLTVRQVYYQFVSRDWIPNTLNDYKRLASIIDDARLAGQIDWERIQDRTRHLRSVSTWGTPADIIDSCVSSYREDLWKGQPCRLEIWIEKDAQIGNVENVSVTERVPFLSCRGYTSQSEMWRAAQRLYRYAKPSAFAGAGAGKEQGQQIHIIHLGDHDPSGIDMSRDIQDRLDLFTYPGCIELHRIALNMDQVKKYGPPPNPAKLTDSRSVKYVDNFGDDSWELDALDPKVIQGLIRTIIAKYRNKALWDKAKKAEDDNKATLSDLRDNYDDVKTFLKKRS